MTRECRWHGRMGDGEPRGNAGGKGPPLPAGRPRALIEVHGVPAVAHRPPEDEIGGESLAEIGIGRQQEPAGDLRQGVEIAEALPDPLFNLPGGHVPGREEAFHSQVAVSHRIDYPSVIDELAPHGSPFPGGDGVEKDHRCLDLLQELHGVEEDLGGVFIQPEHEVEGVEDATDHTRG